MSLFVCMNCGAVENTNCCNPRESGVKEGDNGFPNMHTMDMHGFDDVYEKSADKYEDRTRSPIRMLCSECNTGTWHDEFEKGYPTEAEALMASQLEDNTFTLHPLYKAYNQSTGEFDVELIKQWNQAEEDYRREQQEMLRIKESRTYELRNYSDKDSYWGGIGTCDPYIREEAKIGRNDSCPCGSGKKYKKCCINKVEEV